MASIVLLTQPEYAGLLMPFLRTSGADVVAVAERDELARAAETGSRLISFAAKVIVPAAILARFSGRAYNFHPGPPAYPGIFPSVFALYDGQREFAVTLHEMAPQVDSGPIVAVERFTLLPDHDRLGLDTLTFQTMLAMVAKWAPRLTDITTPLPHIPESWTGRHRTRADFNALCELGDNPTAQEFTRRLRAVGEGPEHALTLSRFGRRFALVSDAAGPVVRGGVAAGDS